MKLRKSFLLLSLLTLGYNILQPIDTLQASQQKDIAKLELEKRLYIGDDGYTVLDSKTHKEVKGYAVDHDHDGIHIVDTTSGLIVKKDDLVQGKGKGQ